MVEWLWQYSSLTVLELASTLLGYSKTAGGAILADLPFSVRGIRESMHKGGGSNEVLVYLLAGVGLIVGIWLLLNWRKNRQTPTTQDINNPDELFNGLLRQLPLEQNDKELLGEMTAQARLRHPTVCLLSPGLLAWSGRLWQTEKGAKKLDKQKIARLNEICVALYDHKMPTSIEG